MRNIAILLIVMFFSIAAGMIASNPTISGLVWCVYFMGRSSADLDWNDRLRRHSTAPSAEQ